MPKDNIERAIKRGQGGDAESYDEVRYEGYGPGGVAVIVEALTDNRNRTASAVRSSFGKHGGALGETNSVSFQFNRVGQIRYPAAAADRRRDAGGRDRGRRRGLRERRGRRTRSSAPPDELAAVQRGAGGALRPARAGGPELAAAGHRAGRRRAGPRACSSCCEALDDNDDVQRVIANFEVSEAALARLAG